MANETLSIRKDQARLTVIGKSKADTYIDSGLGLDIGDLDIGSLDPFDLDWEIDVPDPDNLPDEIRIITLPTKTEYRNGEKIDLSGAVVGAYKNGSIWTSVKYPNGHIPLGELIVNPIVVREASSGKTSDYGVTVSCLETDEFPAVLSNIYYRYGNAQHTGNPYMQDNSESYDADYFHPRWEQSVVEPIALAELHFEEETNYGHITALYKSYSLYAVGKTDFYEENSDGVYLGGRYYVHNHQSIWINGPYYWGISDVSVIDPDANILVSAEYTSNVPNFVVEGGHTKWEYLWTAVYGTSGNNQITVSWQRPVDSEILSDTFKITTKDQSGGNGGR